MEVEVELRLRWEGVRQYLVEVLAGRLLGARQHRAHHHNGGTARDRLVEVRVQVRVRVRVRVGVRVGVEVQAGLEVGVAVVVVEERVEVGVRRGGPVRGQWTPCRTLAILGLGSG